MDKTKFTEVVLYIAKKSEEDPRYGATKLNKILFFSDFGAYGMWGESITGTKYYHLQQGPVPTALMDVRRGLIGDGDATIEIRPCFDFHQERLVALREPDLDKLSKQEVDWIDQVISVLKEENAHGVSEKTHKLIPYRLTKPDEEIPYFSAFGLFEIEPSTKVIQWAQNELSGNL
jgi:hypothetical protein